MTDRGEVVHERLRTILDLPPLESTEDASEIEELKPVDDDSEERLDVGDLGATADQEDVVAEDAEEEDEER